MGDHYQNDGKFKARLESRIESMSMMNPSFEQTLIDVWRQVLVENAKVVMLVEERYPIRLTPKRQLREVDFTFGWIEIRGLEQNLETKSQWAQMARSGKKVMQFLGAGRYVANVGEGRLTLYYKKRVNAG
jgi:hypothetical protein